MLASSADDESIIVWNVESGSELYSFTGHENKIESISFVKNNLSIANIYNSDYVELFNKSLTNGESGSSNDNTSSVPESLSTLIDLNKKLLDRSKTIAAKEQKINKEYIISASRDKSIKIWDVYGSSCIYTFSGHDNWVRSLALHPNGKYLISCSDDKSIRIWELKTGRCIKKILDAHDRFVVSLSITHKFLLMASGSNDQTIKIWDCK
jgi:platelet-activating factor acetylhydrolase IB subunit alpha